MARPLLPQHLEDRRMNLRVLDSLPAKGYPGYVNRTGRLRTVTHLYDRTTVLGHVSISPDEAYALTNKAAPHALYEIMVISAGTTHRPGLHDHSPEFGKAFGVMADSFADHCRAYDLTPVVSWSYDPKTLDRESIQGEKRFHAHLVGRTKSERATVAEEAVRAGQLSTTRARRIVEEASILGSLLSADCVDPDALRVLVPVPALSTPTATVTAQFLLPNGWESLTAPGLHDDLVYVHRKLRRTYDEIIRTCTTGTTGLWERPVVREFDADEIGVPLRTETRATLAHYLRALRPEILTDRKGSNRSRGTHVYPLADLAYAVTIAEQNDKVYLHLRTNLFSDLGGAGISIIDGAIVKTKKGVGTLRADEIAARNAFQAEYLGQIYRHPLASRVFFPRI
ncbi:hypothetical protein [Streptomyces sp. NBC_01176]|uniref:hypothetical protein n=1 Tax=Streptomyces sp. NBC_01176 TaxID=2903760 RepID=UPI002F91A34E|nr:hypothetical protein OG199_43640 [Streptomyces sp. NBC_01176]WSS90294.1 hypothetical protein OG199_45620 [Streptomyces sp. NBC_01176]